MWIVCLINYKEESRDTAVGNEIPEVSGRGHFQGFEGHCEKICVVLWGGKVLDDFEQRHDFGLFIF